ELFAAKRHLSALVDRVVQGEEIVITKRGVAMARLVPLAELRRDDPRRAVKRIHDLRRGLSLNGVAMWELIDEGRP
ncbi:MAG: type II toxin-antitoxin system prevent-host-death family antitoxin, partial [Candidatus Binataceae bacterium]